MACAGCSDLNDRLGIFSHSLSAQVAITLYVAQGSNVDEVRTWKMNSDGIALSIAFQPRTSSTQQGKATVKMKP